MFNVRDLQKNVVLAPYATYKIGGPADYFFIAKTKEDMQSAIVYARENHVPYFVLGTGANILFGDKGFRGLVIKNETNSIVIFGSTVTAHSGVVIADLIEQTKEKNLSGFEHFAGIPSTVGGALWQNLHFLAPNRVDTMFIDSIFEAAIVLLEDNTIQKVDRDFFRFGYDYSILHDKNIIVLEATFNLVPKGKNLIENQIQENLKWRYEKQPQLQEFPSCGSVFKKIEGVGIGRIIDELGLKGFTVGGAQISTKHANYIVNTGNATAADVLAVIDYVKKKIKEEKGFDVSLEISLIGEF